MRATDGQVSNGVCAAVPNGVCAAVSAVPNGHASISDATVQQAGADGCWRLKVNIIQSPGFVTFARKASRSLVQSLPFFKVPMISDVLWCVAHANCAQTLYCLSP